MIKTSKEKTYSNNITTPNSFSQDTNTTLPNESFLNRVIYSAKKV